MKRLRNTILRSLLRFMLFGSLLFGCNTANQNYDYGTSNDNARSYFLKGWQEIMDNGRWTESEIAFRKASELDPNWALGKSMVARITQNLNERQRILKELQETKHLVGADERLLLEANILSHIAANNRDNGIKNSAEFNQKRWVLAESNFGAFARKHPKDNYFKAEYIELLHLNHGAQTALDSLRVLATSEQRKLGFYLGYEAALELELKNFKKAIELAEVLKKSITNASYNSPFILQAQIYQAQDSVKKAKGLVDEIVTKDPKHLIALGMQHELKNLLKNND